MSLYQSWPYRLGGLAQDGDEMGNREVDSQPGLGDEGGGGPWTLMTAARREAEAFSTFKRLFLLLTITCLSLDQLFALKVRLTLLFFHWF